MKVELCDLCGAKIYRDNYAYHPPLRVKVKRQWFCFTSEGWDRLAICGWCADEIVRRSHQRRANNPEEDDLK